MGFLQNADVGSLLLIGVGCAVLCVVGLLLFFGLQILGTSLHTIVGLVELVSGIVNGGPLAWCGCITVLFICAIVIGGTLLFANCQANPTSMNFCLFFR
ncbi:MAG: hypothetical protein LCI00_03960 [Chloroflexi bacterium]|nr:hypothetical protein [Chloroflexota bacterium]MCC6891222.1 hypothetical protein [Anaerolineae bacterium]